MPLDKTGKNMYCRIVTFPFGVYLLNFSEIVSFYFYFFILSQQFDHKNIT